MKKMNRQERMKKIKKAFNFSRLKESFLKVILEKGFTITEEIPEAEGLWSHLGDPTKPLAEITAYGKRKNNHPIPRVPDHMEIEYQIRFNDRFEKNLSEDLNGINDQELIEAASDEDNIIHQITIDEAIEIDGRYNTITIHCHADHQKLFKKILKLCINHRI